MTEDFDAVKKRAHALRLTERELIEKAGISWPTYWRARAAITKANARVRVLRKLEGVLDRLEGKVCSLCDETPKDGCQMFGCPFAAKEPKAA